jgi:hypothetical protein
VAWLLKIETDSILIKEKRKHLSKTSDRVSKMLQRKHLKFGFQKYILIYEAYSLSYNIIQLLGGSGSGLLDPDLRDYSL